MERLDGIDQFQQQLARLEDIFNELESLSDARLQLTDRLNRLLIRLGNCRHEQHRLMKELEEIADNEEAAEMTSLPGLIQFATDVSSIEVEVQTLANIIKVLDFELNSLDASVNEVEVEIESLSGPVSLRTNSSRGH